MFPFVKRFKFLENGLLKKFNLKVCRISTLKFYVKRYFVLQVSVANVKPPKKKKKSFVSGTLFSIHFVKMYTNSIIAETFLLYLING